MMNKKISISITALILSTTNTIFAAENPFIDVPTDHWSLQAVAELAKDGVIEGYGDGSFRGDAHITRYEMAQMVAKAMAKSDVSPADKATLDKLSAEYATELDNLGVRVNELEKKTDNVKFSGYMYLRTQSQELKNKTKGTKDSPSVSIAYLDLFTTAKVNDNWNAVLETTTLTNLKDGGEASTDTAGLFAQGKYGQFTTRIGRFDQYSGDGGLVLHGSVNGGEFTFGNRLKTTLTVGRMNNSSVLASNGIGNSFDYQAAEFAYAANKTTTFNAGYYHLNDESFAIKRGDTDPNIYTLGFSTALNKDLKLTSYYLKSSSDQKDNKTVKDAGYYTAFEYKGPKLGQADTWGLYLKYANIPELTQVSMDVGHFKDYKGFELGSFYMLTPNMRGHLRYYHGENVDDSNKTKDLVRAEVRMFF